LYPKSALSSIAVASSAGADVLNYGLTSTVPTTFNGGLGAHTLNVIAGTFTFNTDSRNSAINLVINVSAGALVLFKSAQHIQSLTLADGASATMLPSGSRYL